jgi:putative flippase GtrA
MKEFLTIEFLKNKLLIKYATVGLAATLLEVIIIFILSDFLNYWYLISCSIAYLFGFFVSFIFRKFWVF